MDDDSFEDSFESSSDSETQHEIVPAYTEREELTQPYSTSKGSDFLTLAGKHDIQPPAQEPIHVQSSPFDVDTAFMQQHG